MCFYRGLRITQCIMFNFKRDALMQNHRCLLTEQGSNTFLAPMPSLNHMLRQLCGVAVTTPGHHGLQQTVPPALVQVGA